MSSAYGKIDRPSSYDAEKLQVLLPIETKTDHKRIVSVHSLTTFLDENNDDPDRLVIISYLQALLNNEIESGNSFPQKYPLNLTEFTNYFLSGDAFIVVNGEKTRSKSEILENVDENILGTFYIKPNFPGRCSHVRKTRFFLFLYLSVKQMDGLDLDL